MNSYISWAGDSVGRLLTRKALADEPDEVRQLSQAIDQGNAIWRSWIESTGGSMICMHGDEGRAEIPASHLADLPDIREQYSKAVGSPVSVGIGMKLSQADQSLLSTKLHGGDQIVFYSDEIAQEVAEAERKHEEEETTAYDEFLGKAERDLGEPPPGFSSWDEAQSIAHGVRAGFERLHAAGSKQHGTADRIALLHLMKRHLRAQDGVHPTTGSSGWERGDGTRFEHELYGRQPSGQKECVRVPTVQLSQALRAAETHLDHLPEEYQVALAHEPQSLAKMEQEDFFAPLAKSIPTVPRMNSGAGGFTGASRSGAVSPQAPHEASEHSENETMYSMLDGEDRPPVPERTHAANDLEGMEAHFHALADAQESSDHAQEAQKYQNLDAVKQQIGQVLMQLKTQAPTLEQLKQAAPEAYAAIGQLVQATIAMAQQVLPQKPGGQEAPEPKKIEKDEMDPNLSKGKLPMPEVTHRTDLHLPVGSVKDDKFKVAHADGSTSWKQGRSGLILSQDPSGHATSSRVPDSR